MSFLAPFLFALAGFAAVPILLHLIRRKRVRILDFPTFRYLQKAALQQRMHLRLQDQLLMLLRILVLLLLVLAFVGPLTSRAVEPKGPVLGTRNLLIIDDSLSMSANTESGINLFSKALEYGQSLASRAQGEWRVALASEVDSTTGSKMFSGSDPEDFFERGASLSAPTARLSIHEVAVRVSTFSDSKTAVWALSDAAASNFTQPVPSDATEETALNFLIVGPQANRSNWALRELTLNNQPLLDNEPALLTATFEGFGSLAEGQGPAEIEFAWSSEGDENLNIASYSLTEASGAEGRFQTALDVAGKILSASCRLVFREGQSDTLAGDDSAELFPRTLSDVGLTLLVPSEYWRRMLGAALVDYRIASADPSQPPTRNLEGSSVYVLVLGEAPLHEGWNSLLRSRLEAGAGILVLYDERASGARLESWTQSLSGLGVRLKIQTLEPGPREARAGAIPWFAQSLQDILLTRLDWAKGELELVLASDMEGEWFLSGGQEGLHPLFQTAPKGAGLLGSFAVPLGLEMTPLLLEPHWVPLLSQMVKRTLIDPQTLAGSVEKPEAWWGESNLEPISEEAKGSLMSEGIRFLDAERFVADVEKFPSRSHDWTLICLMACLGLAILEIAVSNMV